MRCRSVWIVLVLAAISIATPRTASAQMGVLVGFNSANVDFDVDAGSGGFTVNGDRRGGFVGGVAFGVPLQDMFAVEVDALFAQKGTKFSIGSDTGKARVNYLDIPVLGRVNLPGSGPARVHLLIGPSFNFKLSESFDPEEEGDDEDTFETFEGALVFGGGVTVNRFRIDVRYGLGLSNILTEDGGGDDLTGKNRVFTVMVGYGR